MKPDGKSTEAILSIGCDAIDPWSAEARLVERPQPLALEAGGSNRMNNSHV